MYKPYQRHVKKSVISSEVKLPKLNFSFHADSDKKLLAGSSHFCILCNRRLTSKNRSEVRNLCESCCHSLEF